MTRRTTSQILIPIALAALLLGGTLSCGPSLEVDPDTFAEDWIPVDSDHFILYAPEDSPRTGTTQMKYLDACNQIFEQVVTYLEVEITKPISIYQFTTNQDCEQATGHAAGFVEAQNIYTRIGGEVGGAVALAICNAIDDEAASFPLIKDGVREVFDKRDLNIHREAQTLFLKGGRWYSLPELIEGGNADDQEAYRLAAASFVAYLLQGHDGDRFKMLWRSVLELGPSLEKIYGFSLTELETKWKDHLAREAGKS